VSVILVSIHLRLIATLQPLQPHTMSRDPSSVEMAQSVIRNRPNTLQEDADVAENVVYRTAPASTVTEEQWDVCAATLSAHCGVWSARAQFEMGPWAVPGMSGSWITAGCLLTLGCRKADRNNSEETQSAKSAARCEQHLGDRRDEDRISGWALLCEPVDARGKPSVVDHAAGGAPGISRPAKSYTGE